MAFTDGGCRYFGYLYPSGLNMYKAPMLRLSSDGPIDLLFDQVLVRLRQLRNQVQLFRYVIIYLSRE